MDGIIINNNTKFKRKTVKLQKEINSKRIRDKILKNRNRNK